MTAPTGECPNCGKQTKRLVEEVAGRMFSVPVWCEKCVRSALASHNQERMIGLKRKWKALCPALYRATDPNHPAIDQELLSKIREWDPAIAGIEGIGLHGPTAGCKTRMMFLLLSDLHFRGINVAWVHSIELARASFEQFDSNAEIQKRARNLWKNAAGVKVLLIDDIGKERFTDAAEQNLYWLIERRILACKPTLWTSNASGAVLREFMSESRGPALTRRLAEFSTVHFVPARHKRAESIDYLAASA